MVRGMFSHDPGYPDRTDSVTKLDFYGNDGVCLFKYFVNKDDPQKKFVCAILVLNFACFVFISISYILIGVVSSNSSKRLASSKNRSQINKRNRKMNRRIAIIITTDFCCWVPFIVVCALHFLEILDATRWYSLFSMIILPINSVINPLLYDDIVMSILGAPFRSISSQISNTTIYQSFITHVSTVHPEGEEVEMESKDGSGSGKDGNIRTTEIGADKPKLERIPEV